MQGQYWSDAHITGGEMAAQEGGEPELTSSCGTGGSEPQLLPTICHFASHCDHRDGKNQGHKTSCPTWSTFTGEDVCYAQKKD